MKKLLSGNEALARGALEARRDRLRLSGDTQFGNP